MNPNCPGRVERIAVPIDARRPCFDSFSSMPHPSNAKASSSPAWSGPLRGLQRSLSRGRRAGGKVLRVPKARKRLLKHRFHLGETISYRRELRLHELPEPGRQLGREKLRLMPTLLHRGKVGWAIASSSSGHAKIVIISGTARPAWRVLAVPAVRSRIETAPRGIRRLTRGRICKMLPASTRSHG